MAIKYQVVKTKYCSGLPTNILHFETTNINEAFQKCEKLLKSMTKYTINNTNCHCEFEVKTIENEI